jgi:hypothetical protein
MNSLETASAAASPIGRLGGAFMSDPATQERGNELGYTGWRFYYGGRCGVLGDVDADVVAASTFFIPIHIVRSAWTKARAVGDLCDAGLGYREACWEWGRKHLDGVDGIERINELTELVVQHASPINAPLFAGWRAVGLPDDAPARAAQLLHTLREHRGAMHAVAVHASGLTPVEATVTSKLAAVSLKLFSWPEPWPEVTPELLATRAAADALTDQLAAPAFEALSAEEGDEYVALLVAAKEKVFPKKA